MKPTQEEAHTRSEDAKDGQIALQHYEIWQKSRQDAGFFGILRLWPLRLVILLFLSVYALTVWIYQHPRDGRMFSIPWKTCPKNQYDWHQAVFAPPLRSSRPGKGATPPTIPQYVLDHAPLVYLDDQETYWPGDMQDHLSHTLPELNFSPIEGLVNQTLNLSNLDLLNAWDRGRHVFLTSRDDVQDRPDWLTGEANVPGLIRHHNDSSSGKAQKGYSTAPAVLITVAKGDGIVDAFWFFFYSFNRGNKVLFRTWGNHVGDWEHTLVRFRNGVPQLVFFSEHNFGSAYTYDAVEKHAKRPITYSAIGSHAMYARAGLHPYVLPLGLLSDRTSQGPLWDPSLNSHMYAYDPSTDHLVASSLNPSAPTSWFHFNGHWGDKAYPLSDPRQYGLVGEYHYVNGPLGPRFKDLARKAVCPGWSSVSSRKSGEGEGEGGNGQNDAFAAEGVCNIRIEIEGEEEVRDWTVFRENEDEVWAMD